MTKNYSPELLEKLKSITSKRAKTVIDHILEHGYITTEILEREYNYHHAPRAIRDVREAGIPLYTFTLKDSTGRSMAAYKFGDLSKIKNNKLSGRNVFSKEFKKSLFKQSNGRCAICNGKFDSGHLQIDHKTPYEVGGDEISLDRDINDYMLLCGSCNRSKSWSCEHCDNFTKKKSVGVCDSCYWWNPDDYTHVALKNIRRLDMVWDHTDANNYDNLKIMSYIENVPMPEFIKKILEDHVQCKNPNNYVDESWSDIKEIPSEVDKSCTSEVCTDEYSLDYWL